MTSPIWIIEAEQQQRAHIGHFPIARTRVDNAPTELTERFLARGIEREMVKAPTLEDRLGPGGSTPGT